MAFANKGKVRILRGALSSTTVQDTKLWDGQPFYDKESGKLYVGNGDNIEIKNTPPINAGNADHSTTADLATDTTNVQGIDFSANKPAQFGDYIVSKKRQIESIVTSLDINTSTYLIDFGTFIPISTIMTRKFVFTFLITYTNGTSVLIKSTIW